jgi:nitrite reductase/ring-hydroxylating ferredoxin subunit
MSKEKKYKWFRLADTDDPLTDEKEIIVRQINNKQVCITRFDNQLYAFAYKCPHSGGILADGEIDRKGNIICPLHRYEFNIKNGFNSSGEGFYLSTYPVETRADGIYIGFQQSSIWDIFSG